MCGIAGFAGIELTRDDAVAHIHSMCDAMVHRGPDSDGYHIADGVALGMRRLSIIDVVGGQQPIRNEDGSITVIFNGEIYNHLQLRQQLETSGHCFRTRSDTEVLVHLYEDLGPRMLTRLQGMFAFAIWDANTGKLLLARDRTGMKPLNYMVLPQGLVFCSELRSLWRHCADRLRISPGAVMQYLAFGYVPHPATIFDGVFKLSPGHFLEWTRQKGAEVRRYWTPPRPEVGAMDETEVVETLRAKLDSAVASHLEAEVPLGAFLSGGLDSSTVVALMTRHASTRVRTFSIGFAEEEYDESAGARAVAAELGTDHTSLVLKPDVEDTFEAIAGMFDEPFGDSSAIPTFLVSQLARQSVTVALSGDGGDELFGGYTRYRETLGHGPPEGGVVRNMLSILGRAMPHMFPGRNRLVDIGRSRWGRYAATIVEPLRLDEGGIACADTPGADVYINDQLRDRIPPDLNEDFAAAMMQVDLETYLPGDILTKVDRASMAVSLEARVPLLDTELVDFALRIPGRLRVTAGESKRIFRRAIEGIVPKSVLARPKKGFAIPLGRWFRGPLRHRIESLRNPSADLREYIDTRATRRLVFEHVIRRRDHSALLWRLIVLDSWLAALRQGRLARPPVFPRLSAV